MRRDPVIARWLAVDLMAEKYPTLSPYVYCANNPIKFIDVNGDSIQITDSQTQQDFINSLPEDVAEYIRFNDNGVFDINYLMSSLSDVDLSSLDINLQAAIFIGQHEQMVSLEGSNSFQYADANGNITTYSWAEIGFTGFTTAPDGSNCQSLIPRVVDVRYDNSIAL